MTEEPIASGVTREAELKSRIVEVLETVFDPEIPVNIYELGLVAMTSRSTRRALCSSG